MMGNCPKTCMRETGIQDAGLAPGKDKAYKTARDHRSPPEIHDNLDSVLLRGNLVAGVS